ncbi:FERM and PDZ domain-containing protein 2-like [Rhinatrema bivittatum]|uniref:FERM and PDZ domain-containing protein 2-like n=1 Tax=Rhinatrema bivittatum TaxID=194408 RepID=UPI00112B79C0|nr:FERM and PDZ domain-containing protein 2-like [Rhinatrema bivittatum]
MILPTGARVDGNHPRGISMGKGTYVSSSAHTACTLESTVSGLLDTASLISGDQHPVAVVVASGSSKEGSSSSNTILAIAYNGCFVLPGTISASDSVSGTAVNSSILLAECGLGFSLDSISLPTLDRERDVDEYCLLRTMNVKQHIMRIAKMSCCHVTLAEVLQAKGGPLDEDEIWALLQLVSERVLEDLNKGSCNYVICPWSLLLLTSGHVSIHDIVHPDIGPFKAPDMLQIHEKDKQIILTKMLVYSLGMTLYWSADYMIPPHQPLQLSSRLHSILVRMCEELAQKRPALQSILEQCKVHQEESSSPLASASIQQLARLVLGSIPEVEQAIPEDSTTVLLYRSEIIRKRFQQQHHGTPTLSSQLPLQKGNTKTVCLKWARNLAVHLEWT